MLFWDFLIAFFVALALVALFAAAFRRPGPWVAEEGPAWVGLLVLFTILFLASWAGGTWIGHVGPTLYGVYWLPFLAVGLI
ncbi:MAG: hypothetical protein IRY99_24975, partial [Isosphaeraceae bacterium]|nr:hypothetical protein [Isosphaeraceae bacterium]